MNHPYSFGKYLRSPGGNFIYKIIGPCCQLYDREELPWPSCSLSWKGKQPSWNRIGKRFVPDMAASRCPSYWVEGRDLYGNEWNAVVTIYYERLNSIEKQWWYTKLPANKAYPESPSNEFV